jgi:hypothetical protein
MRDKNKDSPIDPKSALYYWLEIYNANDLFIYQARTQPSNPTPQSQLETGNSPDRYMHTYESSQDNPSSNQTGA